MSSFSLFFVYFFFTLSSVNMLFIHSFIHSFPFIIPPTHSHFSMPYTLCFAILLFFPSTTLFCRISKRSTMASGRNPVHFPPSTQYGRPLHSTHSNYFRALLTCQCAGRDQSNGVSSKVSPVAIHTGQVHIIHSRLPK